jgi:hypothetical protein
VKRIVTLIAGAARILIEVPHNRRQFIGSSTKALPVLLQKFRKLAKPAKRPGQKQQ